MADASDSEGGGRAGLGAWVGRHAVASIAVVFAAGALLGGFLIWAPWRDDDQPGRFEFSSTEVPGEYLYLDPERVVSYLAQIRGGFSSEETQTESESVSEAASAEAAAVSARIERRRETGVSRVVTATTAADFLNLLDKLQDPRVQQPVRVERVEARPEAATPEEAGRAFADDMMGLTEGDFVIVRNLRVLMPRHVRPYDTIRRLGVAGIAGDPATRRELRRYLAAVGADPTIVLNVGAHALSDDGGQFPPAPGDGDGVCPPLAWPAFGERWPAQDPVNARILMPVRYGLLAPESSLLSGGDSIVVGKVIRVLREPPDPAVKPRETDVCFADEQARRTFTLTQDRIPEAALSAAGTDRDGVARAARGYAQALAPAAVVIPVAIYR